MIGDNVDLQGLRHDAASLLERAERNMTTYLRIARSDDYKNGSRAVAAMRVKEFKRDADTIRRLMEAAFAA